MDLTQPTLAEVSRLEIRLKGMPVCYSAKACSKVLQQRAESIDAELEACRRRDSWLGSKVETLNATLQSDLEQRRTAMQEIQAWIKDLRSENQRMISEVAPRHPRALHFRAADVWRERKASA